MHKQTIIITGASRGLGRATALISVDLGANVVISARSTDQLESVAQTIHEKGGEALPVSADISRLEDCERVVNATLEHFGRIDGLINNAGVLEPIDRIENANLDEWHYNLIVNLLAPVAITQAALPHLRRTKGRVIHVSSGAAESAIIGWSAYCAAKAAINHFSRVLALEEPDVTSITFRPGVVDTQMQALIRKAGKQGMTEQSHQRFLERYENGELLPPEKPGRALAFLGLYAPNDWSGEFIEWNESRVKQLEENI